jgi:hypothetical protein
MKSYITTMLRTVALSLALFSNVAWAGYVYTPHAQGVFIDLNANVAFGNKVAARYSGDANQYIGCEQYADWEGVVNAICSAHDYGTAFLTCSTSDPNLLAVIRGEVDWSYVYFSADRSSGVCTSVYIDNRSLVIP